jgi:hypothetical protein
MTRIRPEPLTFHPQRLTCTDGHTAVVEFTTMEPHIGQSLVKRVFSLLDTSLYFLVGLEFRRDSILTGR